ncbi:hypothetical protein EBR66_06150 [bacterium]|nr:hypothetical protein [bacterium]
MAKRPKETKDGRSLYGSGGRRVQAVYEQKNGKTVRDSNGKSIVVGYRVRYYEYTDLMGQPIKTPEVSLRVDVHPDQMSTSDYRKLELKLSDLVRQRIKTLRTIISQTENLELLKRQCKAPSEIDVSPFLLEVQNATGAEEPRDEAIRTALTKFYDVFDQHIQDLEAESNQSSSNAQAAQLKLEEAEKDFEFLKNAMKQADRMAALSIACVQYLLDSSGAAKLPTKQLYEGYLRNHILVPTAQGRTAIGDLLIPAVTKAVLRELEESMYKERDGFRATNRILDRAVSNDVKNYITQNMTFPMSQVKQKAMKPVTAKKVLDFLGTVVEWAMQDPSKWSLGSYPINTVRKYKMKQPPANSTRVKDVPTFEQFEALVSAAEELGLGYMVPMLALTWATFRPSESRALMWSDVNEKQVDGNVVYDVAVQRSLNYVKGAGEILVDGAKTAAAATTVRVPNSIMELILKHRVPGCEFLVPPRPAMNTSNGRRKKHEFLTRTVLNESWHLIASQIDLPKNMNIYKLKHGMISQLIQMGHNADQLTLMTRHTSSQMIMQVYGSIDSDRLANSIDELFKKRAAAQDP